MNTNEHTHIFNAETQRRRDAERTENLLSEQILDAAIEVHRTLGPGLLESIYEDALFYELKLRNIPALKQVQIPVTYKNCILRESMRLDILVNNTIIIEVKATRKKKRAEINKIFNAETQKRKDAEKDLL